MANRINNKAKALLDWVDARFPLSKMWNEHLTQYYVPKNFNFWYYFGSLALFVLAIRVVNGMFLTMNRKPDGNLGAYHPPAAFTAVECIMHDMSSGRIIRYMYPTGASFFSIVVYLHMFRGLIYDSYRRPHELVWIFSLLVFLTLMVEAFMGYLPPWGQMSFWDAQIIINLFSAIPVIGPNLSTWAHGDFSTSDVTLSHFFALHVIAASLVLIGLVVAHIIALHEVDSNSPDDVEIKKLKGENGMPLDGVPFHSYYTIKDILGVVIFLIVFCTVLFFVPEGDSYFLETPNFDAANSLKTLAYIAPAWYFTPFYTVLRAIPSFLGTQVWGVIGIGTTVVLVALLPWLDRGEVKSVRYRGPIFKTALALFIVSFIGLGILGTMVATNARTLVARILSFIYFVLFLSIPFYTELDKTQPVSERVTMSTTKQKIMFFVYIGITPVGAYLFATYIW